MYKQIEFDKSLKDLIAQPLPDSIIKQRPPHGNAKPLRYIEGSTVIDILNNITNYMWDWKIESYWVQESIPKYDKYKQETIPQNPVAHVIGTLTMHFVDENGNNISISKSGMGSKSIVGGQGEQESIFKAASTDAIKKAASLMGIGAQLYRDSDTQAYFEALSYQDPWT